MDRSFQRYGLAPPRQCDEQQNEYQERADRGDSSCHAITFCEERTLNCNQAQNETSGMECSDAVCEEFDSLEASDRRASGLPARVRIHGRGRAMRGRLAPRLAG